MKVLEVVGSLGLGGTERTAVNFSIGLFNRNCDVIVFAISGGVREKELQENGIKYIIGIDNLVSLKQWIPDIIHIHNHGIDFPIYETIRNKFPESKICEQNVFGVPSPYTHLDMSFQLAEWCKWNFINRRNINCNNIEIIPNPINTGKFYPPSTNERNLFRIKYKIPENAIVLLRVGQPIVAKWNIKIVDIYKDLSRKYENLYMVCVGAPNNVVSCFKKKIKEKSKLIFIDKIDNDNDLRICYGASDIFLHMARIGESFGIVLTEAMMCGIPVVSINTPYCDNSQSEVVGHLKGGIIANRYNGIIKAVSLLIDDKLLYSKLKSSAPLCVRDRFSIDVVVQKMISLLNTNSQNNIEKIRTDCIYRYLSNAIDSPIPFAAAFFKSKKFFLNFMSERLFRYLFRIYCRIFDKSVQL